MHFLFQTHFYGFGYSDNGNKKGDVLFFSTMTDQAKKILAMGIQQHVSLSGD